MNTLKELAKGKIKERQRDPDDFMWETYRDNLNNLSDEIQGQRLVIMELEERNGAIAQENEWLEEEVSMLKGQVMELEQMIYGEKVRYYPSHLPLVTYDF